MQVNARCVHFALFLLQFVWSGRTNFERIEVTPRITATIVTKLRVAQPPPRGKTLKLRFLYAESNCEAESLVICNAFPFRGHVPETEVRRSLNCEVDWWQQGEVDSAFKAHLLTPGACNEHTQHSNTHKGTNSIFLYLSCTNEADISRRHSLPLAEHEQTWRRHCTSPLQILAGRILTILVIEDMA